MSEGDSSPSQPLPLRRLRVIDLSRYVAGPYCASILADLGAEVIRVEPIGGGEDRELVPLGGGSGGALFLQSNRNKKSIALDTRSPDGRALLERLIQSADVVITNMPAKTLRRLSLDRDSLERIKPDIITANVSAFGNQGVLGDRNGFDGVGQGMSGSAYLAGSRKSPSRAGCSFVDYGTGLAAALGVLAGLIHKMNGDAGLDVQASLLATALTFANGWHIEEAVRGLDRAPFGNLSPNSAPSDIYRTRDGFIVVQVIGRPMFARWADLVGRTDLLTDKRFATDASRGRNGRMISKIMQEWLLQRSSAEALETLAQHGLPAGPVYSPRQLIEDALVAETGVLQQVAHPGLDRPAPLAGPIVRLGKVDMSIRRPAPAVGEDTLDILGGLGLTPDEISALETSGIVSWKLNEERGSRRRRRADPAKKTLKKAVDG